MRDALSALMSYPADLERRQYRAMAAANDCKKRAESGASGDWRRNMTSRLASPRRK